MADIGNTQEETQRYTAREAVGVFADPAALESAVDELEISGFNRAAISVLSAEEAANQPIGEYYRSMRSRAQPLEKRGDEAAAQGAFVSSDTQTEGKAAAVGVPAYIGSVAGAAAVVASGGALAAAIVAALVGGAAGGGLGALLARTVGKTHARDVEEQLGRGGLVLWVSVIDQDAERRALDILNRNGGRNVHVNEVERHWRDDRPVNAAEPDPLLRD